MSTWCAPPYICVASPLLNVHNVLFVGPLVQRGTYRETGVRITFFGWRVRQNKKRRAILLQKFLAWNESTLISTQSFYCSSSSCIIMPRVGRSGDNRMFTCIEASKLGFAFIDRCSKCDYYLQNHALNMKALSLPRSQLSKMWQCTSLHRVGDLNSSVAFNTPYQEVPVTSYNS